jgi:hypothetical protein
MSGSLRVVATWQYAAGAKMELALIKVARVENSFLVNMVAS